MPGANTVGRGLKELAEENIVYKSEISGKSYSFNAAEKLDTLLLRMIRQMGLIKVGSHVDLDLIISLFLPTSLMQSILTNRILATSLVGLPLGALSLEVRIVMETPM